MMNRSKNNDLQNLKILLNQLQYAISLNNSKASSQKQIYLDFIKMMMRFAQKVSVLSQRIKDDILNNNYEEMVTTNFQFFSDCLIKIKDSTLKVAYKTKNQVLEPLKIFTENYTAVANDFLNKINSSFNILTSHQHQLTRSRQIYIGEYEKLNKYRSQQSKVMTKVENGNLQQLSKYNASIKKITEQITESEKIYKINIQKTNDQWRIFREKLKQITLNISHNEQSRVSFARRTVISAIKFLEGINEWYDPFIDTKIENKNQKLFKNQKDHFINKDLYPKMHAIVLSDAKQTFQSYQQIVKIGRRKSIVEENNSNLQQIFHQVRDCDKKIIRKMLNNWFLDKVQSIKKQLVDKQMTKTNFLTSSQQTLMANENCKSQPIMKLNDNSIQLDECKEKILSVQPYSLYFIQCLYNHINDMKSFYCKLSDDNFYFLSNCFMVITKLLDLDNGGSTAEINIQFIHKMMEISIRIMWKKNQTKNQSKTKPIELLCHHYGKTSPKLKQPKTLLKLLNYGIKRKANRKKTKDDENKGGMIGSIKGFYSFIKNKKDIPLTEDENFNCIQELITLLANFSLPTEVILPFIKEILAQSDQASFQYLRSIIFAKKDIEERQKIFYRKQVKQKKEKYIKNIIENKHLSEYCFEITARQGFLSISDVQLRLVSSRLRLIHQQILAHLPLSTKIKWINLIPFSNTLQYLKMKQEVAENSVPSAVEEIITLDVNRSLHLHGQSLNPTVLHSLLRTYAYYNQQISYCQGMNYIAGYLFIKAGSQQNCYRIFTYLMEIRFKELFKHEFQILKIKMYQFQRLLSIFHPQISDHFKRQAILPECYIVSWMITLFASSYQYTLQSHLIDFLWQRFIIWGWKEFFRFLLWIFFLYKDQLVELTYDKALNFLGELGKSKLFLSSSSEYAKIFKELQDPNKGLERYQVSDELLENIRQEYQLL